MRPEWEQSHENQHKPHDQESRAVGERIKAPYNAA